MQARATDGDDCIYTSTTTLTSSFYATTTFTAIATGEKASESFPCPPMSLTYAAGDELFFDKKCHSVCCPAVTAPPVTTGSMIAATAGGRTPVNSINGCGKPASVEGSHWHLTACFHRHLGVEVADFHEIHCSIYIIGPKSVEIRRRSVPI